MKTKRITKKELRDLLKSHRTLILTVSYKPSYRKHSAFSRIRKMTGHTCKYTSCRDGSQLYTSCFMRGRPDPVAAMFGYDGKDRWVSKVQAKSLKGKVLWDETTAAKPKKKPAAKKKTAVKKPAAKRKPARKGKK